MSDLNSTKRCSRCGETKPLSQFNRRGDNPNNYRSHCKACVRADYEAKKEVKLAWQREYRLANLEREIERARAWREANPEKQRAASKRYYEAHREQYCVANRKRRVRAAGARGSHTGEDVKEKYKQQNGKCYWCGQPLNGTYHVDHIVPISRGGGDGPENICCACPFCNLSKHNKMPWEFSDRLF